METAKAHFRAKVEHPYRIIKCQFGFRKVFYRGIRKNDLKLKLLLPWPTSGWYGNDYLIQRDTRA